MDGYELCKAIKSDSKFMDILFSFLPSLRPKGDYKRLESGAYFIVKPYSEELLTRLRPCLHLKRKGLPTTGQYPYSGDSPTQAEQLKYLLETRVTQSRPPIAEGLDAAGKQTDPHSKRYPHACDGWI